MKDKYLIGLANLSNGALLGYGNKEAVEENKARVNDYVKELESIRDKAIEYVENCDVGCYTDNTLRYKVAELNITELLEILESSDSNE